MDQTSGVIIGTNFGKRYCYPKNIHKWVEVLVDSYELDLIRTSRFEAHCDNDMALSTKVKIIPLSVLVS